MNGPAGRRTVPMIARPRPTAVWTALLLLLAPQAINHAAVGTQGLPMLAHRSWCRVPRSRAGRTSLHHLRPIAASWPPPPRWHEQQRQRHFHGQPQQDLSAVPDHYAVLGVDRDSDVAAIRAAYTQLVRQLHPDTAALTAALEAAADELSELEPEPEAVPRAPTFNAVVEAYGVLSDEARRRHYDELLALANSQWLDKALRKAASADSFNFRRRTRRSSSLELLQTDGAASVLKRDASAVEAETWDLVLGTCAQFAHVKMALEIYHVVTQDYGKKTVSPHLLYKIQLPRQARDKRRQNSCRGRCMYTYRCRAQHPRVQRSVSAADPGPGIHNDYDAFVVLRSK
jgi:curved DNA-binding protein CbpA